MADPRSHQVNFVNEMVSYLEQETISIDLEPELTWSTWELDISSNDPPRGAVYIPSWTVIDQQSRDLYRCVYHIVIRLLVSKPTATEAIASAHAWAGQLCEITLPKLRCVGHNGYFKGLEIKPNCAILEPQVNQDGGAKTAVLINCEWTFSECADSDLGY